MNEEDVCELTDFTATEICTGMVAKKKDSDEVSSLIQLTQQ